MRLYKVVQAFNGVHRAYHISAKNSVFAITKSNELAVTAVNGSGATANSILRGEYVESLTYLGKVHTAGSDNA